MASFSYDFIVKIIAMKHTNNVAMNYVFILLKNGGKGTKFGKGRF